MVQLLQPFFTDEIKESALAGVMRRASKVLLPEASEVLNHLLRIPLSSFYLAAGTGLAFQLEHRVSVDFDFFSSDAKVDLSERESLKSALRKINIPFEIETDKEGTLILLINKIRVSFFHYPYPMIESLVQQDGLFLASVWDIGAMKLSAVVGRGTRRDFVDLYVILQKVPFEALLQKAAWKFSQVADFPFQALKALTYFEDASAEPMPQLLKPLDWKDMRRFFEREARELSTRWLK